MKLKIIDLLKLVYENKAPKKILYKYCEYEFNSTSNDYENKDGLELFSYLFQNEEQALIFEVEIIEEKPKEIEKIKIEFDNKDKVCKLVYLNSSYKLNPQEVMMLDKIEELRIAVNYLLKKEDE